MGVPCGRLVHRVIAHEETADAKAALPGPTVPRVLFVTDQWGYGTTTGATSIAAALEGSATRWLIGEGAGFTLGRRGSFDDCIPANTTAARPPEALKEAIRESDVVVSVMNLNAAKLAGQLRIPCLYVDTLLWMWDRPPTLPSSVTRYFAAGFPGVEGNALQWKHSLPRTEVVAPLITPSHSGDPRTQTDVLVNFGGLSAPLVTQGSLVAYARAMVDCIVHALADWPGGITISMGEHVLNPIDRARVRLTRPDARFVDLSHPEYLRKLAGCRLLVSSPGLSATQEAFATSVPCLLLPSQNLSQTLSLQAMDRARAAFALDWDAIYGLTGLTAQDERGSCQRIADCIHRFEADPTARTRLAGHLAARLAPDCLEHIASAQAAFFRPHRAEHGPQRVAAYVRHLVSPAGSAPSPGPEKKGPLLSLTSGVRLPHRPDLPPSIGG
jgi:hypothetical protein